MKATITLLILAAATVAAFARDINTSIRIDSPVFDFGVVNESTGKVTHKFLLKNVGKESVSVLYVKTGCSCVSAVAPSKPIAPGASAPISVTFDPKGRSGDFHKEISIVYADKRFNRVTVRGTVNPDAKKTTSSYRTDLGGGLKTNQASIDFGSLAPGEPKTIVLRYVNEFPVGMKLTFELEEADPDIDILIPSGNILAPDAEGSLPVTATVKRPFRSTRTLNLIPISNGYRLSPIPLTIKSK